MHNKEKEEEKRGLAVMSDRAANCVLGDKDGEQEELPPGYRLCSGTVAGLEFGGRKKREAC